MNKRIFALTVCLLLSLPVLVAPPAVGHDAPNRCGHKRATGAGWFKVRGHEVGCERARKVARRWEDKCVENGSCPPRRSVKIHVWPGFVCRYKQAGKESVKVRCTAAGERIVHFYWGS